MERKRPPASARRAPQWRPSGRTREPRPPLSLRVTARDIGLGPRRLSLSRAYVRTSDPVRSLPRVVCVFGAEREEDASRVSAVSPTLGAHSRASDPRDLIRISNETSSGDGAYRDASRAARPPLARPPRMTVSRSSLPRTDGFPPTRVALVKQLARGDLPVRPPRRPFDLRFAPHESDLPRDQPAPTPSSPVG